MPVHVKFLERFSLFGDLPEAVRDALAAQMSLRSAARREVIFGKDRADQGLGLLLDGRLQGVDFTFDGREVGLYFVAPGEPFGELAVVDGLPAPEHIIALTRADYILLPPAPARALLDVSPALARTIATRLAARLRQATGQRALLALASPMQRLCAQLLELAREAGEIAHAPTHQEFAIMINTTRETVTRAFQALQARGVLAREGARIRIDDLARLRRLAMGEGIE